MKEEQHPPVLVFHSPARAEPSVLLTSEQEHLEPTGHCSPYRNEFRSSEKSRTAEGW